MIRCRRHHRESPTWATGSVVAAGIAALLSLAPLQPARAAPELIYVDDDATGATDGSTWDNAYTDLQDAIAGADGDDVIVIAEGVYYVTGFRGYEIDGSQDGVEIHGGYTGSENLTIGNLELDSRDLDEHPTILSGDVDHNDVTNAAGVVEDASDINGTNQRVFYLEGRNHGPITAETVIEGLTITGGHEGYGGGLYCFGRDAGSNCSPTIRNVKFIGNSATSYGGAIYNNGFYGGQSSPIIIGATFVGNFAGTHGGAIKSIGYEGASSPTIINTTFIDNAAGEGGAMFNGGGWGVSSPTLINVAFIGNRAEESGGAIYTSSFNGIANPTYINVTFAGNTAATWGGAVFINNSSSGSGTANPALTNAIFWGNSATSRDQIYNINASVTIDHGIVEGGCPTDVTCTNLVTGPPDFVDTDGADGIRGTIDDDARLLHTSPAIDAGDTAALPNDEYDLNRDGDTSEAIPLDLAGHARVYANAAVASDEVDVGAYEWAGKLPTIGPIADTNADEDTATGTIAITIGDPDSDVNSLTLSASADDTALVPDGNIVPGGAGTNRNVQITPAPDANGATDITVTVSDGVNEAHETFTLTVNPVNDAPAISGTPDTGVTAGTAYGFTPTVADDTGDTTTFSISNKPSWASFDTATGTLSGTPASGDVGSYPGIEITVTDGAGVTDTLSPFTITVAASDSGDSGGGGGGGGGSLGPLSLLLLAGGLGALLRKERSIPM